MIFINNKYTTWYFNLISKAQTRPITGYTEKHHIIPKCLGGDNSSTNLVHLTAREHFICHRMLTKMVDTSVKHKLVFAAWQQSRPSKHKDVKISSRTYETLRKQLSETYTGRKRAPITEQALANMRAGFKTRRKVVLTEEEKDKRDSHLRKIAKERNQTGANNPFYGKKHTPEISKLLADKNRLLFTGVPKNRVSCIHCHKDVTVNIFPKYHGDNCKFKP
jgi:hypothetical protein